MLEEFSNERQILLFVCFGSTSGELRRAFESFLRTPLEDITKTTAANQYRATKQVDNDFTL